MTSRDLGKFFFGKFGKFPTKNLYDILLKNAIQCCKEIIKIIYEELHAFSLIRTASKGNIEQDSCPLFIKRTFIAAIMVIKLLIFNHTSIFYDEKRE